jgi:hypothetical protein
MNDQPPIFSNDDGWIIGAYDPPLTPERLWDCMIAPYLDTPVNTFLWSVGGHEVYDFETQVGERFGTDWPLSDPAQVKRSINLNHLIQHYGGPVTVIAQLCRRAGLRFFPSVRMNEHYDMDESAANYGALRRDHLDLLIGRPGEDLTPGSIPWGIRTGLNYAEAEVRAHMSRLVFELFEDFDVDGIELDFMRHPAFFRVEEAQAKGHLLTEMIAQIRQGMDRAGNAKGQRLELAIRVPPSITDCRRIGLEVDTWLQQGLVDVLIGGGGFIPFEMPMAQFATLAKANNCTLLGCFESLRPTQDESLLYAAAARYWDAGVDGLYFFNFYSMASQWRQRVIGCMADPQQLARQDKRYELDNALRTEPTTQLGLSFRNAIPNVQLSTRWTDTLQLQLEIADDLPAARQAGQLKHCTLGLGFEKLEEDIELEIRMNGKTLAWDERQVPAQGWKRDAFDDEWNIYPTRIKQVAVEGDLLEFDLAEVPLNKGINNLELRLVKPAAQTPPLINEVHLDIAYI